MSNSLPSYDYVLVGGGLQAGLLALAIDDYKPDAKVLLLERNNRLFGNHTWSFHRDDLPKSMTWLDKLPKYQWPAYTVHFPGFERQVDLAYCSTSSQQFESAIEGISEGRGNLEIRSSVTVAEMDSHHILTSEGEKLSGTVVLDCRGRSANKILGAGFQKFYGVEIELEEDWPDRLPVVMEANVDQLDGYRFLYVLPFSRRRVLIEDTRFANSESLDKTDCWFQIKSYLERKGVLSWRIIREEEGCLPMPFTAALKPTACGQLAGGFAGGWFHAATGYSFSLAARFADVVASSSPEHAVQRVGELVRQNRFQCSFSRFLNRLLFQLVSPTRRHEIFHRFYRSLPNNTIQRFYAHTFTKTDAARILFGSPPGGLTPIRFLQSYKAKTCQV
jgi:lycopene beta-cyclase